MGYPQMNLDQAYNTLKALSKKATLTLKRVGDDYLLKYQGIEAVPVEVKAPTLCLALEKLCKLADINVKELETTNH